MISGLLNGERVVAHSALERNSDYLCPECLGKITLKFGRIVTPHFAHHAGSSCSFGTGESREHLAIKFWLYYHLVGLGFPTVAEQVIGSHRTDIYSKINGKRYCFEIQCSPISEREILDRMITYSKINAATVWIIHDKKLWDANEGAEVNIRRWWALVQRFQYGLTFLAHPRHGLKLCHLDRARSWVDHTDWGGGYWRNLKTRRTISFFCEDVDLLELQHSSLPEEKIISVKLPFERTWWPRRKRDD